MSAKQFESIIDKISFIQNNPGKYKNPVLLIKGLENLILIK